MRIADIDVPGTDSIFIAGEWSQGNGDDYEVVTPHTEEVVTRVSLPDAADATRAVDAAAMDPSGWAATPLTERINVCERFCELLEERLPDLATVWAVEAGMPVSYGRTLHRYGAVAAWRSALAVAPQALGDEVRESAAGALRIVREPAGVVVAILPYNGPLVTIGTKVIPALLTGCRVVVKAALESQLVMRVVAHCATKAGLPHGALSILCGDVDVAKHLTSDARVDMVSLTGGYVAAQSVIDATQARLARTHLELGGKSPAVVLDDAPLESVLRSLVPGATGAAGQVCASLSRVLVSRARHDEVVDAMTRAWGKLRLGDPLDDSTQIGPLINARARSRAEDFIARARDEGAAVVAGGRRPDTMPRGFFFEPTILADVKSTFEVAQQEVFGPVTAVLAFDDEDEALQLANNSAYGLASTVYTQDPIKADRFARGIRAGAVAINTFGPTLTAPYGGMKQSGWGREAGPEGLIEFTELKQILNAVSRAK